MPDEAPDATEMLDTADPVELDEVMLAPDDYPQPHDGWGENLEPEPAVIPE